MPTYPFETVDVFTEQRFGGNPLAVFPDATGISDDDMQRLASEFNLSETTFVLPPMCADNTARVRIFNRSHEMPFAGHPMVGTAFVLARRRPDGVDTLRFEVPAGIVSVRLIRDDGVVRGATIDAPQSLTRGPEIPVSDVARAIGINASDVVVSNHLPLVASVGNTYVIAEVSAVGLDRAVPDVNAFRGTLASQPGLKGRFSLYVYSRDESKSISARMFAPVVGTYEDPATGSAATPLAALLLSLSDRDQDSFEIHQGVKMGRPSLLRTMAHRTPQGIRASVAGSCVPVSKGDVSL